MPCPWLLWGTRAAWLKFTVEAIFLPFDARAAEFEFETIFVWLPADRTRGSVASHFDTVTSSAPRREQISRYGTSPNRQVPVLKSWWYLLVFLRTSTWHLAGWKARPVSAQTPQLQDGPCARAPGTYDCLSMSLSLNVH